MARLDQLIGQTAAGDKAGRYPLATGGHPQPCGQMGFAGATFSQEDDIAALRELGAGLEFPH